MLKDVPIRILECVKNAFEGLIEVCQWKAINLQTTGSYFPLIALLNFRCLNPWRVSRRGFWGFQIVFRVSLWFNRALTVTFIIAIKISHVYIKELIRASIRLAVNWVGPL